LSFVSELKRRNVFRVAIGYVISTWLLAQVADLVLGTIGAPAWVMQTILLIFALGFPVVLFFSWAYEVTPEGIKRESEIDREQSITPITARKLDRAIVAVLVIAVAYFAYDKFVLGPERVAELVDRMQQVDTESAQAEPEATAGAENSIAVLPFVNMSTNQENEYFADGLTETLLNQLAQVADLKVAARTSSFAFKDAQVDIREIGDKLDVANVLEGSVQRSGDRVRITAQLIQTSDGYHLWSQTFDRDLDNIFAVQDEIAAQVANALTGSLLRVGSGELGRNGSTRNTEAYDLYLKGRKAFHANTERQANESERLMRRAITLDPDFALAWAGLAEALRRYAILAGLAGMEYLEEYQAAAEKAAELAPDNSQVLSVLGEMHRNMGEMGRAQEVLERAIDLDPSNASAWSQLATVHFIQGRFRDAAEAATRAMSLDPLDFDLMADSTYKFAQLGRVDKAEMLAQAVLDNDPQSTAGFSALGNIYWRTGRFAEAYRVYHRMLELNPDTLYVMGRLAVSFVELEDWGTARDILQKIETTNPKFVAGSFNGESSSWLCYVTNDMNCVRAVLNQRIAMEDSEQDRIEFQLELARYEEDWESMLQEALAGIENARNRDNLWGTALNRQAAALAADRLGRLELRNEMIELTMSYLLDGQAQGSDSQYLYFLRSYLDALRGDAAMAVPELQAAIDRGYRDVPAIIHSGYFDAILKEPEVQTLLERLRAVNARELERLHAVVDELGPVW